MFVSSKLVLFVTIYVHCQLLGQPLDARILFMSMAMLNNVQFTMTQLMPRLISLGVESLVSLSRISDFLLSDELENRDRSIHRDKTSDFKSESSETSGNVVGSTMQTKATASIRCLGVATKCPGNNTSDTNGESNQEVTTKLIDGITFECESPELIMICGQVGSGKSTLLLSLLKELHITEGSAEIRGRLGFASQTAWIFAGTLRENILFGQTFNEARYNQVIEACALKPDLDRLQYGDFTYIHQDSLSGGQKARVNLARCLYRESDIYLLDDPFSAIDRHVLDHIFAKAIKNFLANKLVLLVTHQVNLFSQADKILLLNRGKQLAFCGFEELRNKIVANHEFATNNTDGRGSMMDEMAEFLAGLSNDSAKDKHMIPNAKHTVERKSRQVEEQNLSLEDSQLMANESKLSPVAHAQKNDDDGPNCSDVVDGRLADSNAENIPPKSASNGIPGLGEIKAIEAVNQYRLELNGSKDPDVKIKESDKENLLADGRGGKEFTIKPTSNQPADEESASSTNKMSCFEAWCKYYTQTSKKRLSLIICTFLITQALFSTLDIYLTVWSLIEQNRLQINAIVRSNHLQQVPNMVQQLNRYQLLINNNDIHNKTSGSIIPYDDGLSLLSLKSTSPSHSSFMRYDRNETGSHGAIHSHNGESICAGHNESSTIPSGLISRYKSTSSNEKTTRDNHISPLSSHSSLVTNEANLLSLSTPMSCLQNEDDDGIGGSASGDGVGGRLVAVDDSSIVPNVDLFYKPADYSMNNNSTHEPPQSTFDSHRYHYYYHYYYYSSFMTTEPSTEHNANGRIANISLMAEMWTPDESISKESESALNVQLIYRPLYWCVNKFSHGQHALTYFLLLLLLFISSAFTNVLSLTSSNKSAIVMYQKLIDNALFAKLSFFDRNPIGRFINRATRDIGLIDEAIPYNANQAYDALLKTAATFFIVALVNVSLALPSLIVLFIFLIFHMVHIKPTRDIQRLEGVSRSPIISHISTTLNGLATIRAASESERYLEQLFVRHQDAHTSIFLLYLGCDRAFSVGLDSLNALYISLIAIWIALLSDLSGPSAGLVITSAMLLSGLTQHGLMKLTETESLMTSVERVIEYCGLPQEENYDSKRSKSYQHYNVDNNTNSNININNNKINTNSNDNNIIRNQALQQKLQQQPHSIIDGLDYGLFKVQSGLANKWPLKGSIEYKQVYLYYSNQNDPIVAHDPIVASCGQKHAFNESSAKPVLKNISFKLNEGEKVGLIGRTGAGKSSIITTLFRLYDFKGTILIDDIDTKQIDLFKLRTSIGIIPQQPILFTGTIRNNLDPFGEHQDHDIWLALDKAHLRKTISNLPGKLDFTIIGGETNCLLSSGQKQLICLARVLLRQSKIVVLDEATANVDPTTEAIIQATIRCEFKRSTVITVAHRIETILDCDRIIILDSGRIADFDTPERLVSKGNNYFANLMINNPIGLTQPQRDQSKH